MSEVITIPIKDLQDKLKYLEENLKNDEYTSAGELINIQCEIKFIQNLLEKYSKPKEESNEPEMKQIGTLNTRWGLNGYDIAEIGHPVYQKGDRYIIFLTHPTLKPHEVGFFKKTLEPIIDKF